MRSLGGTGLKVGVFMAVMLMLTAALFAIFGQYRGGDQNGYTAVFDDVSSLKAGDSVRVAGVRVGTIDSVELQPDNTVLVGFGAERDRAGGGPGPALGRPGARSRGRVGGWVARYAHRAALRNPGV